MQKFLVIQTAFTGDVVLATSLLEKLYRYNINIKIDFLLRKGNEGLLYNHPFINKVLIWDKKQYKNMNLFNLIKEIRKEKYTHVINLQRFFSSGLITFLSGAGYKSGFDKNPFSFCYDIKAKHIISLPYSDNPTHEVSRNQLLIENLTDSVFEFPKLYPSNIDYERVLQFQKNQYICIAPSSVWFTKQFPIEKWIELIDVLPMHYYIYIIGGPTDIIQAEKIVKSVKQRNIKNLCGELSYLQSSALMQKAVMNYVNDSAPLHFATAMNAKVTAVFCSTVPAFGFGPLRKNGKIVEITEKLSCRPCGLHGYKKCPKEHFNCGFGINVNQLLWWINDLKTT